MARVIKSLINIIFFIAEFFLGVRFLLKLFGASPGADFVNWIYITSQTLLDPFRGAFPATSVENGSILEFSTLFAIVIYALVGYFILELVDFFETVRLERNNRA